MAETRTAFLVRTAGHIAKSVTLFLKLFLDRVGLLDKDIREA